MVINFCTIDGHDIAKYLFANECKYTTSRADGQLAGNTFANDMVMDIVGYRRSFSAVCIPLTNEELFWFRNVVLMHGCKNEYDFTINFKDIPSISYKAYCSPDLEHTITTYDGKNKGLNFRMIELNNNKI